MKGMTDYHCHLLPGIDDGPKTLEQSIRMARLLRDAGFSRVHCTPHMIPNLYDATNEEVRDHIKFLQAELEREGIALKLLAGREHYLDEHFIGNSEALLPLEGTPYLLVEIPQGVSQGMVMEGMATIMNKGLTPMIAHPERCLLLTEVPQKGVFQSFSAWWQHSFVERAARNAAQAPQLLDCLISLDCVFQGNLGNLIGYYGKSAGRAFSRFRRQALYTHAGTDAHSPEFLVSILMLSKISGMFMLDVQPDMAMGARACAC